MTVGNRVATFLALPVALWLAACVPAAAATVSRRVSVPEVCAPSVSPAVVRPEPRGGAGRPAPGRRVHSIDQQGMRFTPRVVGMSVGDVLRFGNADGEMHNVHLVGRGVNFNRGVGPGESADYEAKTAGVLKVVCDVHNHMRAYVVVGSSPWAMACDRQGRFRFEGVAPGRYWLDVWREMAGPVRREDIVPEGGDLDLGVTESREGSNPATALDRGEVCETGCEPWPLVIDRTSVTLSAGLDAASGARDGAGRARAEALMREAYFRDFGASGMEAAVRLHLGRARASTLAGLFRDVARAPADEAVVPIRGALLGLSKAADELNRKGVTERSKIFDRSSPAFWVKEFPPSADGRRPGAALGSEGVLGTAVRVAPVAVREGAVLGLLGVLWFAARRGLGAGSSWGSAALALSLGIPAAAGLAAFGNGSRGPDVLAGLTSLAAARLVFGRAGSGAWRRQRPWA